MNIAFSVATENELNEDENFIPETFHRMSKSHLEHTFIFIVNKPRNSFIFSENVIPVVINYEAKSPLKWLYYYNVAIPKVLKKYKADIFISEKFCSLLTKIPQILISPDFTFIHQPGFLKRNERLFYKKFAPKFLRKAKAIIAFSQFEKEDIIKQFKIEEGKIQVISNGINENAAPVDFEERESIKEKYAEGNEFFIYCGIIGPQKNLMNLLKAFSAFKKRQRSKMQLIIAGKPGKKYEEFVESLRLYRFRDEVRLLPNLSPHEILTISASAYAMVYPSLYEKTANPLLEAMKCEVPVLASSIGALPEICGDAVIYFDPEKPKDIAEKMMLIFKDEKMRKELIEKGKMQVKKYNWEKSAFAAWQLIDKLLFEVKT
jgi:glycosyltransferase involved in cell wall biosynthesis